MMKLLELRARIRMIYQRFSLLINPLAKFLLAFITFRALNQAIGFDARFDKIEIEFLLSLLCAFTPSFILVMLSLVLSVLHVFFASPILAVLLLIIFIILYCFLYRYAPEYGYAAVLIPILYTLKMPYVIPMYLGLMANPAAMLPAACGVVLHYIFLMIQEEVLLAEIGEIKLSEDSLPIFTELIKNIIGNQQMILSVVIFSLVVFIVFGVRRLKIKYSFEISIAAGAAACILGFLAGYLKLGIKGEIGSMILGTISSGVIALAILFTRRILDYTAVKNEQFEDDDYYYYVKAVPKIDVSVPNLKVKRISRQPGQEEPEDEYGDD